VTVQPYVVGQWVDGDKFYGRTALIEEILKGNRNWHWLLGTRRIGKTSVLKQIEYVTSSNADLGYFPLFWDLQGSENSEELHMGFNDALLDVDDRLDALGIRTNEVETDDLFRSISTLRRRIRSKGLKLLLLCDEVEELIKLHEQQPSLLRKLRHAMQSTKHVRSVLASTIRLWALARHDDENTSPFLHGFTPPLYIHALSDADATALIRQANLPSDSRPRIDEEGAEVIRSHCDNHPYLIQLVSKRYLEFGDLEESIEQVATDPMVSYFFSVDFAMLSPIERQIIQTIAERTESTSESIQGELPVESDTLIGMLHRLRDLGYIRRNEQRRFVLVNYFFRRWFKEQPPLTPEDAVALPEHKLGQLLSFGLGDGHGGDGDTTTISMLGNRYELQSEAGRGAMGVVYKAHDRVLKKEIALKLLRPEVSRNPDALERFRKEIVLTLDINHPNILPIYHLGEADDQRFLTMKWIDGGDLAQEIEEQGPMEVGRILSISGKLAGALEALHAAEILHRDIKPHNILIDSRDEPYLTDFGLVRLVGSGGMTRDGVFLGTPNYASPEQAGLEELDRRSDIYSLGLIIFEMATGQRPFDGRSAEEVLTLHRSAMLPEPSRLRPDLPEGLSSLIKRCLEKQRDRRYDSASALRSALDALQARGGDGGA
jgi:hypothetical protein